MSDKLNKNAYAFAIACKYKKDVSFIKKEMADYLQGTSFMMRKAARVNKFSYAEQQKFMLDQFFKSRFGW